MTRPIADPHLLLIALSRSLREAGTLLGWTLLLVVAVSLLLFSGQSRVHTGCVTLRIACFRAVRCMQSLYAFRVSGQNDCRSADRVVLQGNQRLVGLG